MSVVESHEEFFPAAALGFENAQTILRRGAKRFLCSDLAPGIECLHYAVGMCVLRDDHNDEIGAHLGEHLVEVVKAIRRSAEAGICVVATSDHRVAECDEFGLVLIGRDDFRNPGMGAVSDADNGTAFFIH